jgi:hypothetical protein
VSAPRKRPFRLTAPLVLEHPLQKQIADCFRLEIAPAGKVSRHGVCWFSVDHANFAGEVPGLRMDRGIVAGIWDTFVIHKGRVHWIEVKTDGGKLSPHQLSVGTAVLMAGGKIGIARNADEALDCLDEWKIPRAHRVHQQVAA